MDINQIEDFSVTPDIYDSPTEDKFPAAVGFNYDCLGSNNNLETIC